MALEQKYDVQIQIHADASLDKNSDYRLERIRTNGDKVSIQLQQPQPQPQRQDRWEKKQKDSKKEEKTTVAPVVEEGVVEETPIENVDGGEKISAKTARNRRRREWKRKKHAERLARQQARREAEALAAMAVEGTDMSQAIVVAEDHLPIAFDTEHKAVAVVDGEEHFTVVEQGRLENDETSPAESKRRGRGRTKNRGVENTLADDMPAPKKGKGHFRNRRRQNIDTEVANDVMQMPAAAETIASSEPVVADMSSAETPAPKNRRGGWWNRLVK